MENIKPNKYQHKANRTNTKEKHTWVYSNNRKTNTKMGKSQARKYIAPSMKRNDDKTK